MGPSISLDFSSRSRAGSSFVRKVRSCRDARSEGATPGRRYCALVTQPTLSLSRALAAILASEGGGARNSPVSRKRADANMAPNERAGRPRRPRQPIALRNAAHSQLTSPDSRRRYLRESVAKRSAPASVCAGWLTSACSAPAFISVGHLRNAAAVASVNTARVRAPRERCFGGADLRPAPVSRDRSPLRPLQVRSGDVGGKRRRVRRGRTVAFSS